MEKASESGQRPRDTSTSESVNGSECTSVERKTFPVQQTLKNHKPVVLKSPDQVIHLVKALGMVVVGFSKIKFPQLYLVELGLVHVILYETAMF